jgi:filamentous hemagglutinin family protein
MSTLTSASNLVSQAVATVRERIKPMVIWLSRKLRLTFTPRPARKLARITALLLLPYVPSLALAAPVGGQVVSGSATIGQPNATTVQVNQTSNKAVLDWQKFSIARGESVIFNQPNAASVALNRVLGGDPSQIFGSLKANGSVFLVNPAGVLFAPGANVDVGGLVGSTLGISNADFNAGNYRFANGGKAGEVSNQGVITANGGYVGLIGPRVGNDGQIIANGGSVGLGAGDKVSLSFGSTGMLNVKVDAAALAATINNKGMVQADGGQVQFVARSADALLNTVINNSGIVRANALVARDGKILLDGGPRGVVSVTGSGSLQARGEQAGTQGGEIKVLGDKVGLFDNASVDASGQNGGGTVLVGGNYQGKGAEANASFAYVGAGASIKADALQNGKGGKVIVWANEQTISAGDISAKGGAQGGDGGFVETSGKEVLQVFGNVNANAPHGKGGTWLLDPRDISIDAVGANTGIATAGSAFTANADSAVVSNSVLGAALSGGTTVDVLTGNSGAQSGNITVNSTVTATGNATLNLKAQGNIVFNAGGKLLDGSHTLNVNLNAGTNSSGNSPGTNASTITMANGAQITTNGGDVSATAKGAITLAGINTGSGSTGDLTVSSNGGAITQTSALTVGGTARFDSGSTGAAEVNLATFGNAFSKLGNITARGGFSLDNTAASVDLTTLVGSTINAGSNNVTITAGPHLFLFGDGVSGTSAVTAADLKLVASDGFRLGQANLSGVSGHITLESSVSNAPINLNSGSQSGALNLASSEIDTLRNSGASNIVIGANGSSGQITLVAATNFGASKSVTLNGGAITYGSNAISAVTAQNLILNANSGNVGSQSKPVTVAVTNLDVNTGGGSAWLSSGGAYNITGANVGAGLLSLTAGGNITQTGAISAGTLSASNPTHTINLSGATNHISHIDGISAGSQVVSLKNDLTIDQVGSSTGITAGTLNLENTSHDTAFNAGNNAIANLGTITSTAGSFSLTNTGSNLALTGDISAAGHVVVLDTGIQSLNFGNRTVDASSLSATSHSVAIGATATLANGGTITLTPDSSTAATSLAATSSPASYNLDATAFSGLRHSAASAITIGAASSTLPMTIGGAVDLTGQTVTLHAGSFIDASAANTITASTLNLNSYNGAIGVSGGAVKIAATDVSVTTTSNNNAFLTSTGGYNVKTSNVGAGKLDLTAGAALTQTDGSITAGTLAVNNSGGATTLDKANQITSLGTIAASGKTFTLGNARSLGQGSAIITAGTFNYTNTGGATSFGSNTNAISNLGSITTTGGGNFTLKNAALNINGAIDAGSHNVNLTSTGAVAFGGSTITAGALGVTSGGAITQTGAVTLNAATTLNAGANAITLSTTTNQFGSSLALSNTGAHAILVKAGTGGIALGNVTSDSTLAVTSKGDVTQAPGSALNVTGTTTVTLDTTPNLNITLANNGNISAGQVVIAAPTGGATLHNLSLANSNASTVAPSYPITPTSLTLNYNQALTLPSGLNVGTLDVTSTGVVAQAGAITVTGDTTINAGNGITLNQANNSLQGTVALKNSNTADSVLTNNHALDLAASDVKGKLTITTKGGGVSQSGDVAVGDALSVTAKGAIIQNAYKLKVTGTTNIDADTNAIILDTAANSFGGSVALKNTGATHAITLNATGAVTVDAISTAETLTVTAGSIAQSGTGISADHGGSFKATSGSIVLGVAGNAFSGGSVALDAETNISIKSNTAITLGSVNAKGTLSVDAGATIITPNTTSIDQNGTITVGGASSFTSHGNKVDLTKTSNTFGNEVSVAAGAGAISLSADSSATLTLGKIGAASLTIDAGKIAQGAQTINVTGTSSFNPNGKDIDLSNNANHFGGAIGFQGAGSVSLVSPDAVILTSSNTTGLNVTGNGITQENGGVLTVSAASSFTGGAAAVKLDTTANKFGGAVSASGSAVALKNDQALILGDISSTAAFAASAKGTISQNAATKVQAGSTSATILGAGAADILLDKTANDLGTSVTLAGPVTNLNLANANVGATLPDLAVLTGSLNDVTLNFSKTGLDLPSLTIGGKLAVTVGGNLGQLPTTSLTVGNDTAAFTANGFNITLPNVSLGKAVTLNGANATITSSGALQLAPSHLTGDLTVTGVGLEQSTGSLVVDGKTTLNAGDSKIDFGMSGNSFGQAVSFSHANEVTLKTGGALTLGSSTVAGNLALTAGDTIGQNGALNVTGGGTTNIQLPSGGSVNLAGLANNFSGAVTIGGSGVQNVLLRNDNGSPVLAGLPANLNSLELNYGATGVDIPAVTLTGALTVTANGKITQAGDLSVGTSTILDTTKGFFDIELKNASNVFSGDVTFKTAGTGSVNLVNNAPLQLGASTVGKDLTLSSKGDITQSGALTVGGDTSLTLSGNGSVKLAGQANDFTGKVALIVGGNTLTDLLLRNDHTDAALPVLPATTLHDLTLTFTNSAVDLPAATVNGALNVTAGKDVKQTAGAISVVGSSTITAGTGIDLSQNSNNFQGQVLLSNPSGSSNLHNGSNALNLGASTLGGDLTLHAGALAQNGDIAVSGALDVTASGISQPSGKLTVALGTTLATGAGSIALANVKNDFHGVTITNATGVQLADANDLSIAAGAASIGALDLTLNGKLTQTSAITASGTTINLTGSNQDVTLNQNNSLGAVKISGSNVHDVNLKNTSGSLTLPASVHDLTLDYTGDIALDDLSANSLTINNVGALSQVSGKTVSVTNGTTITQSGSIKLDNSGNSFGGTVILNSTGNAALKTVGDLALGASTVGGALTLTAGNGINASGQTVKVSGTTTLSAGSTKAITLDDANNLLGTALTITNAGSATLVSKNGLDLQGVTLGAGDFNLTVGGDLSQTGAVKVGTGNTTISAVGKNITLGDNTNQFGGTVKLSAATATLKDSLALKLGDSAVSGKLDLTSAGATTLAGTIAAGDLVLKSGGKVSQSGGSVVVGSGGTSVTLDAGGDVQLDKSGNDLGGTLTIAGSTGSDSITLSNAHSGGVTLNLPATPFKNLSLTQSASAIALPALDLTGNLTLTTTNQGISQGGAAVKVAGATQLTAGSASIALGNTSNRFDKGLQIASAGSASIGSSSAATDLQGVNITAGDFSLTAIGGEIKQSGVVKVSAGNTTLSAVGQNITLANTSNEFSGTVKLTGAAVTLKDSLALTLGDSNTTGKLDLTSTGSTTLSGTITAADLAITSGGAVSQSAGSVTIGSGGGTKVSLTSGGSVALDQANDLGATVAISGSKAVDDISLTNIHSGGVALTLPASQFHNLSLTQAASAIALPAVDLGGDLTLTTSDHNISESSSPIKVAGVTKLTAGSGTITLADSANRFVNGVQIISAGNTDLKAGANLDLKGANITGNLSAAVSGGNLSQSGKLTVSGDSTLSASGSIMLADGSNNLGSKIKLNSGGAAELANSGAVTLVSGSNVGSLMLTGGGDIGQTGAISITGSTTLTLTNTGNVSLNQDGNDLGSSITVNSSHSPSVNLKTKAGSLTLPGAVNDLTLNYTAGEIKLGTVTVGGKLDVTTSDKLSQLDNSAKIIVTSGDTSVHAVNGIALGNSANNFGGKVSLNNSGSGAVLLNTVGALDLANSDIKGNLNLTAGGKIGQSSGNLSVSGTTDLAAGGDITLNASGNDFGGTVSISQGQNVTLNDINDIKLGVIANINNLIISAAGSATLSDDLKAVDLLINSGGKVSQTGGKVQVSTGGTHITLSAGGNVQLDKTGNDLGATVAVSGSGVADDISLTNVHSGGVTLSLPGTKFHDLNINQSSSAIALPALDLGGALTLTTNDQNISQTGAPVKVAGLTKLTAGAGVITLGDTSNRFDNGLEIVSAGSASIGSSSAATDLQGVNVTAGDFSLTALGGEIKQSSGVVKVSGNTTLSAAGQNITLGNAANQLAGTVKLSGAAVTVKDSLALTLGDSSVTGKLDVTSSSSTTLAGAIVADDLAISSGGTVSQSGGSVTVGSGGTSVSLTQAGSVILDKANDLGATLAINGSTNNTNDITLTNSHNGAVTLSLPTSQFRDLKITHSGTSAIALPAVDLAGALTLVTANQNISQTSGPIKVAGASQLTAGSASITLGDGGNRFANGLEIVSASAATIGSGSTLDLHGVNISTGDLSVTNTGGDITQSAVVKVGGNTTLSASGHNITLADASNQLAGTLKLTGASVTLKDSLALTLGDSAVSGKLDLTSGAATTLAGSITAGDFALQSGATVSQSAGTLVVGSGGTSVNLTGAGNVLLDKTGNDLGGKVSVTGGSVQNVSLTNLHNGSNELILPASVNDLTLDYTKALALGTVKVNGNLIAKTGEALTQVDLAQLQVVGSSDLTVGNGITLANASNALTGTVSFTSGNGGAVLLNTTGKLNLGKSSADGNLTVTAGGAIEQKDDVTVKGNLALTANGASSSTITQTKGSFTVDGSTALAAGGNITLSSPNNDFKGAISITKGKAVTLADKNAIILGAISGIDSLDLLLFGDLTQEDKNKTLIVTELTTITEGDSKGNIDLSNNGNLLTGGIKVNGAVHDFKLTNDASNAGSITLPTVGGDLTLKFKNSGVVLNGTSVTGNLDILAGRDITQVGAINVTGSSLLEAKSGINLPVGSNSFGGPITLKNTEGGNVILSSASGLTLGGVGVANGSLQLTSAGSVGQSGPITQSGGAVTVNGSSILLNGSNSVGGVLSFNGGSVEFTNSGQVLLGASTIGSNLKISAGGDISQNAPLSVSGEAAFFSNGSAVDIKLGELANNFSGTVTIGAVSGGSLRDVELRNAAQVASKLELPGTLRNLKLSYDNSGISLPLSNLTGNLEAKAGGDITQTGPVIVPGSAKFDAGSHAIKLDNPANDFGLAVTLANTGKHDVAISDVNGLTLASSKIGSGALTLLAKGDIKQSGSLVQEAGADKASITSQGGAITLQDAGNDFTGALGLYNSGKFDVAINDVNALILADSKLGSGKLIVTAHGALTQTGPIVQAAGAAGASFGVGANSIKLDNAGNDFVGPVDLSNSGKNDVTLWDANTLQLGKVNVGSGLLSISGKDGISQSSAIVQEAAATGISLATETGTVMVNDANNQITGGISINNTGGKDIVIDNKGSVLLSKVSLGGGSLQVIAGGDISQNDALVQATKGGVVKFETGSGKITIDNANNDFTGAVSLKSSSGTIKLNDKNDLILGDSQLGSGSVAISSHGNLSQTGALVQGASGGTVLINADKGNISLTSAGNDFTGPVALTGAVSQIVDANALNLGLLNTGNLSVTSHGALNLGRGKVDGTLVANSGNSNISQSAALTVTGTSDLNAGTGNIRLVEPTNDFGGKINVTAASAEIVSRALAIAGSIESDLTTKSSTLSLGNLVVKGKLDSSATGAVTQTDLVKVGGLASIKASGNSVTLDKANEFTSIALDAANVTLNNAKALTLAGSNVTGSLNLTTGGALGQSGNLVVTGPASINAGANAIKLDGSGNDFKDSVSLKNSGSANAIAIADSNGLKLGAVTTDGNLSVSATGVSQDAAGLKVGGTASINGGAASINLSSATNDFIGAVSLQNSGANAVSVVDANALVLGTSNVGSATFSVKAGGAISQTGALKTAGDSSFDAGSNAITLNSANQFGGAVKLAGGATQISGGDLNLSGAVADLTANASGKLTQSASLKVSGNSNLKAVGDIDLSRNDNDLAGNVTVEAANINLQSANNLSVALKTSGNATVQAGKDLALSGTADKLATISGGASQFGLTNVTQSVVLKTGGALTLAPNGELNVPTLSVFVPLTQDIGTLASPFILNKTKDVTVLSIHNGFFKTPIGANTRFDARALPLSSCVRVNGSVCVNGAGVYNGALEAVQSSAVSGLNSKLVKEDVLTRKLKYGLAGDLQQAKAFPHKGSLDVKAPASAQPGDVTQRAPLQP